MSFKKVRVQPSKNASTLRFCSKAVVIDVRLLQKNLPTILQKNLPTIPIKELAPTISVVIHHSVPIKESVPTKSVVIHQSVPIKESVPTISVVIHQSVPIRVSTKDKRRNLDSSVYK